MQFLNDGTDTLNANRGTVQLIAFVAVYGSPLILEIKKGCVTGANCKKTIPGASDLNGHKTEIEFFGKNSTTFQVKYSTQEGGQGTDE